MFSEPEQRPDPELLLNLLKNEEEKRKKGRLKIFFGMCAGVGKTYDMLKDAHAEQGKGVDVVIGYVETHHRPETDALVGNLPMIPRRKIEYRGTTLEEMDLDAILTRSPKLALVDELAHTNVPGSRHTKRFQDVLELLENGIDVFTTLNVQHLESRAETVAQITGSVMRETVPDSIFESADEVEVIDISPDELLKRLAEGKVYTPERSRRAVENFFRTGNLTALREMSLRLTAERVDQQLRDYMKTQRIQGPWRSGARFVVGINADADAIAVVRWARRLAYTLDATWAAVNVETSSHLTDEEKKHLFDTIKLARELGAEIFVTSDEDIAEGILRTAREQNATLILVGKPRQHPFFFSKSIVQDLLNRSVDVDVYIVGQSEEEESKEKMQRPRLPLTHSGYEQYLTAGAIVFGVALACFPFTSIIGYRTVSLLLLMTVSLLPLRMGPGPVLVGAAVGAVAWDFFFIPPIFTFSVGHGEDMLMLGIFFVVSIVTGVLSARVRAREFAVRQRERRTSALYSLTKDLSSAHSQAEVLNAAVTNIHKYFDADVVVYLGDADGEIQQSPHPSSSWSPDEKEFSVAAWTYWNERRAGRFTETLPSAQATYFSMSGPRYPLGVIGVKPFRSERMSIEQESLLENFIAQIASAIERELLNDVTKRSVVVEESERLYRTLFNSISHELRTPIAAILGASENLLSRIEQTDASRLSAHLQEIHSAGERLNRLVANLLDMSRIESGMIHPKLDWCDLHDLVQLSIKGLEHKLINHPVQVEIAENTPLVKLDFGLMEQTLTNLLYNATVHTPPGTSIEVSAGVIEQECVITVADNGPGIPPADLSRVFEKFFRSEGSRTGGTGLGLPIARGFVEAHHGSMVVRNRDNGVEFTIRIKAETALQSI